MSRLLNHRQRLANQRLVALRQVKQAQAHRHQVRVAVKRLLLLQAKLRQHRHQQRQKVRLAQVGVAILQGQSIRPNPICLMRKSPH